MAQHLANLFCTKHDKVNCGHFFLTGACKNGLDCSRFHAYPLQSDTILLSNVYHNQCTIKDFLEDLYEELTKYGHIEEIYISNNEAKHLHGNTYVKFLNHHEAAHAFLNLLGRFYWGEPLIVSLSPMMDIEEAMCRYQLRGNCLKGGECCYLHLVNIERRLLNRLEFKHGCGMRRRTRRMDA